MDIEILKSLIAVAETGSFSRAATKLCVSQSAVSKRVKQLEEMLGFQLLDRSGAQLKLTEAGCIVERNAKGVLDICRRCSAELAALRGTKRIEFRCTPSYGLSFLPLVTKELMEQRPDITNYSISVGSLEDVMATIKNGGCQLAVVEHCDLMPIDESYLLEKLDSDQLILVASPSLGLPKGELTIEQLLPFTLYIRSVGCCSRMVLESNLNRSGFSLDMFSKTMICDDLNMILNSLRTGQGIGYIANDVVRELIADGTLMKLDLPEFNQHIQRSLLAGAGFVPTDESSDLIRIIRNIAASPLAICGYMAPVCENLLF